MCQVSVRLDVVIISLCILCSLCLGGITNVKCSGDVWVEPATVLKMGMNVSVYCQSAIKNCQPRKLRFYKNGIRERSQITSVNQTTVRLFYKHFMEPRASIYCTAECARHFQETLVCGKDISSGYPPDAPSELACVIHEHSGNMTCTWNTGRLTHLDTKYVVHLKSLETEEEQQYLTSSYINISTDSLRGGRKYLLWVHAVNVLGTEKSPQLQIHLDDIVIPSASVISGAETINASVPKTIIHWNSKTKIEKISCEMRYKATTNQTWNVKEFDTNFTHTQNSEFYLESNLKYEFQVRCQETGKRYWQVWSSPFVHKTPERVSQVSPNSSQPGTLSPNSSQPGTQNPGMLMATIFKEHLTSDNGQDIGLLSGMVFLGVGLSIFSLIGILNQSLRRGIKRKILLLIPKWLHEDIPNMENSNVAKMLQEKSVFMYNDTSEQVLYVDPVVTEIGEISLPEHKSPEYEEEELSGALETSDCPQTSPFTSSSVVYIPDLTTGYKPQTSSLPFGGKHLGHSDERDSSVPDLPADSFDLGRNTRLNKYSDFSFSVSSMNSLGNTPILKELSLILNRGECDPPDIQNSVEEEASMLLEKHPPGEVTPEQTLLPDEFVSCLAIGSEEMPSINSYFPQNVLESHFGRISLVKK